MSNKRKKGKRRRPPPPPPRSSPPPPPPPPPPPHPIMNLLPPATRASLSSLSLQEMDALAYLITVVLVYDTFEPTPSSIKVKEIFDNFPGNQAAQKSPFFGCHFFPCYRNYWERWISTSSSNRRRIDVATGAFKRSLQRWRSGKANSMENWKEDKRCSCGSLPALDEVGEERSEKEKQDSATYRTRRSFAGNVIAYLWGFLNPRKWRRKV